MKLLLWMNIWWAWPFYLIYFLIRRTQIPSRVYRGCSFLFWGGARRRVFWITLLATMVASYVGLPLISDRLPFFRVSSEIANLQITLGMESSPTSSGSFSYNREGYQNYVLSQRIVALDYANRKFAENTQFHMHVPANPIWNSKNDAIGELKPSAWKTYMPIEVIWLSVAAIVATVAGYLTIALWQLLVALLFVVLLLETCSMGIFFTALLTLYGAVTWLFGGGTAALCCVPGVWSLLWEHGCGELWSCWYLPFYPMGIEGTVVGAGKMSFILVNNLPVAAVVFVAVILARRLLKALTKGRHRAHSVHGVREIRDNTSEPNPESQLSEWEAEGFDVEELRRQLKGKK